MSERRIWVLAAGLAASLGCAAPPDAPEGLQASTSYLVRHFYDDEQVFAAGVSGFAAWFEGEGRELVDLEASSETADAFTLQDLTIDDVARLPVADPLLASLDAEVWEDRDPELAQGVISIASLDCDVYAAERVATHEAQKQQQGNTWDRYERTYETSRDAFLAGWDTASEDRIRGPIDRSSLNTIDGSAFLATSNRVDPAPILFVDVDEYEMLTDFRHGEYEIAGERRPVTAIFTTNPEPAWGKKGGFVLMQSYTLVMHFPLADGTTIRSVAVWSEPRGSGVSPESALSRSVAANKSLASSKQLSEVCSSGSFDE